MRLVEVGSIIDSLGAEYGARVGGAIKNAATIAAEIGRDGVVDQLIANAPKFKESIRRVGTVAKAAGLLDSGLLEYHEVSKATYGLEAIQKMRSAMSRSALNGETFVESWQKMAVASEMPEWRAERIVRTETAFASNRSEIKQIEGMYGKDIAKDKFRKQLFTTFDGRTGEDSVSVHEQIRKLDENFEDSDGRLYQHPPNRPNDREVMVIVPAEDEDFDAIMAKLDGMTDAEQDAWVQREFEDAARRVSARLGGEVAGVPPLPTLLSGVVAMAGPVPRLPVLVADDASDGLVSRAEAAWVARLDGYEIDAVQAWNDGRHTDIKVVLHNFVAKGVGASFLLRFLNVVVQAPRSLGAAFRGIHANQLRDLANAPVELRVGVEFELRGLTSWSRNRKTAEHFAKGAKGIVFEVAGIKEGMAMISGALRSNRGHEEVILLKNTRFRILRVSTVGGRTVVAIEEVKL